MLGPSGSLPRDAAAIHAAGASFWPLVMARELDDAILHLRLNEPTLGLIVLRSEGDPAAVLAADDLLEAHKDDWLVREIRLYWKRVLKRIDMTSRSLIALIEPGSCFAGTLAELLFAADRSVMFAGTRDGDNRGPASLHLSDAEFRRVSDGQRPDAAGDTFPRRARQLRGGARTHGRGVGRGGRRGAGAGHRRL